MLTLHRDPEFADSVIAHLRHIGCDNLADKIEMFYEFSDFPEIPNTIEDWEEEDENFELL